MKVFDSEELADVCDWLKAGNLLAYPTEAVWGIGCDPFNERAVKQILAIKNRPVTKGMIVIAPSIDPIQPFFNNLSESQTQAILQSWHNQNNRQQATTWLFPLPNNLSINIPDWVTGGRDSLAIRLIAHPMIAQLCQSLISPSNPYGFLISTSCNPSGETPANNLSEAQHYFGDTIAYFEDKTLGFTQPSQIKNAVTGELVRE